jgi:hypothetical protein
MINKIQTLIGKGEPSQAPLSLVHLHYRIFNNCYIASEPKRNFLSLDKLISEINLNNLIP